jgi:hypothetical protein
VVLVILNGGGCVLELAVGQQPSAGSKPLSMQKACGSRGNGPECRELLCLLAASPLTLLQIFVQLDNGLLELLHADEVEV